MIGTRVIENTRSYQAALASTSLTVGEKWWMPVMVASLVPSCPHRMPLDPPSPGR